MGTTLHYGGMIGSLELEWFWDSLTDEERKTITSYSLDSSNSLPDQGKIGRTSASQLIYLVTFLIYASSRRQYDIAETLIRLCENAKGTDLDFHYFYINAGDCYYNQIRRGKGPVDSAIHYYELDVDLFPRYKDELYALFCGQTPYILSFQRLATCYEIQGRIKDAIAISKQALDLGMTMMYTTENGFQDRIERLKSLQ